jgi:GT2 family glycosyltransferase
VSSPLEISVVVSTYQRPGHLKRCLQSLAAQQGVDGKYEVIVVDDGSQDETAEMVARFARTATFPLKFATHPHEGFQLARCRNAGIRIATAPYILFTDGDCIFPANHLRRHLDARRPGIARAGDCIKLDQAASERIDESAIRSGAFANRVSFKQRLKLRRLHAKLLAYQMLHRDNRVKLTGWNMGVWREDLERVNGFDERFRGWGCEDDDLARRLRRSGVRVATCGIAFIRRRRSSGALAQTSPTSSGPRCLCVAWRASAAAACSMSRRASRAARLTLKCLGNWLIRCARARPASKLKSCYGTTGRQASPAIAAFVGCSWRPRRRCSPKLSNEPGTRCCVPTFSKGRPR